MKLAGISIALLLFVTGCSSQHFDQPTYDRQNTASKESLNSLDHE